MIKSIIFIFVLFTGLSSFADICEKQKDAVIDCGNKNNTLTGQELKSVCESEIKDFIRAYNASESCGEIYMAAVSAHPFRFGIQDTVQRLVKEGLNKETVTQEKAARSEQQELDAERKIEDDFRLLVIEG